MTKNTKIADLISSVAERRQNDMKTAERNEPAETTKENPETKRDDVKACDVDTQTCVIEEPLTLAALKISVEHAPCRSSTRKLRFQNGDHSKTETTENSQESSEIACSIEDRPQERKPIIHSKHCALLSRPKVSLGCRSCSTWVQRNTKWWFWALPDCRDPSRSECPWCRQYFAATWSRTRFACSIWSARRQQSCARVGGLESSRLTLAKEDAGTGRVMLTVQLHQSFLAVVPSSSGVQQATARHGRQWRLSIRPYTVCQQVSDNIGFLACLTKGKVVLLTHRRTGFLAYKNILLSKASNAPPAMGY